MNQENNFNDEIELSELFKILKQNILIILITSAVFMTAGFLFTFFLIKPQYQSQATLIVNNKREENTNITTDEMNTAKNLAGVYSIIIKSDSVMSGVVNNLSLDMTTEELSKKITVSAVDNTQVMRITTKDTSPERAQQITAEVVKIAPDFIVEMVEAGSVKIIADAKLDNNKVSPNLKMNVLVSLVLGMMLSIAYVLVKHMMDRSFKSESDVERILDLPVLGIIPNVDSVRGVK